MARRVSMSVDPVFRELIREIKKSKPDLSDREITKELANEITGKSLLKKVKKKDRNEIIFNF